MRFAVTDSRMNLTAKVKSTLCLQRDKKFWERWVFSSYHTWYML